MIAAGLRDFRSAAEFAPNQNSHFFIKPSIVQIGYQRMDGSIQ